MRLRRGRWSRPRNSFVTAHDVMQDGPSIFVTLTTSWGLVDHERYAFWRALSQATWSQAVAFRQDLLAFYPVSDTVTRVFLDEAMNPVRLMAVCEALVQEGYLTRATASRIEGRILDTPGWGTAWQYWEQAEALQDVCTYIETYWR